MSFDALLDRLTGRQRQGVAIGILALGLAFAWSLIVAPVIGWVSGHHSALSAVRARAEAAQEIASREPELSRKLEQLKADEVLKTSLFAQATDPNPAARLQAEARRLLGSSGAQIANSQILPETSEHGFRRLALRVTMRGSLSGLQRAVHSLESAKAAIFVHGLSIRTAHAAPRPGSALPPAADLTMVLELHAYMEPAS